MNWVKGEEKLQQQSRIGIYGNSRFMLSGSGGLAPRPLNRSNVALEEEEVTSPPSSANVRVKAVT